MKLGSCVCSNKCTISLRIFYNLVWGGERLTSGSECLAENLPPISKSTDLSRNVPNPLNPHGIPVTLYVLSIIA